MPKKLIPSQTSKPAIRAYLGGSFNPVHNGHIQMAMAVYNRLAPIANEHQCELQVALLPNARSPFKEQSLDPKQRLAMLKLAVQDTPLQIDELELWQTPPVYSIDSVRTLRQRYPDDTLIFIMGMDSARSLDKWKNGLQLTDYVHLWMFERSGNLDISKSYDSFDISQPEQTDNNKQLTTKQIDDLTLQLPLELQAQVTDSLSKILWPFNKPLFDKPVNDSQHIKNCKPMKSDSLLKKGASGRIYIDQRKVLAVSSTEIRKQLRQQLQQQFNQPVATNAMNVDNPANNLTKWLNPTVYHYIIDHQLYSTAQFR